MFFLLSEFLADTLVLKGRLAREKQLKCATRVMWETIKPKVTQTVIQNSRDSTTSIKNNLQRNDWTKESSFRLPRKANLEGGKVNTWEERRGLRFICRFLWCYLCADKKVFFPPHPGRVPFTLEIYLLLGSKKRVKVSQFLLFLTCLSFKIINLPKWPIQGGHILVSFSVYVSSPEPGFFGTQWSAVPGILHPPSSTGGFIVPPGGATPTAAFPSIQQMNSQRDTAATARPFRKPALSSDNFQISALSLFFFYLQFLCSLASLLTHQSLMTPKPASFNNSLY